MNFVIISGSRNPEGQTAQALRAVQKGIEANGGKVETIFLPAMKIERCRQCDDSGWGICIREGQCIIPDDFAVITAKICAAKGVVFATPVYYADLSESLRAYLDRLRRTLQYQTVNLGIKGKRAIGVCVAGGGGGGAPSCCTSLEKILAISGFDVLDMVPVRRQNLKTKLPILEQTGAELVNGK